MGKLAKWKLRDLAEALGKQRKTDGSVGPHGEPAMHMKRFSGLVHKNDSGIPLHQLFIPWTQPVRGQIEEILLCLWQAWPGQGRAKAGRPPA